MFVLVPCDKDFVQIRSDVQGLKTMQHEMQMQLVLHHTKGVGVWGEERSALTEDSYTIRRFS